jgi:uncharacterized protein
VTIDVIDAPDRHRFEAVVDGRVAGVIGYEQPSPNVLTLTHTEVDPDFEGMGVGSELARRTLDQIRERGGQAVVLCPFVKSWLEKHPDYGDLVVSR